eukprot:GILK01001649.1.p1 GENE.GILK01001649.1~~GILK01001649.1.p1  ORF type:complete len:514 (-),score=98.17 GILK01001649.1:93-1592(-)
MEDDHPSSAVPAAETASEPSTNEPLYVDLNAEGLPTAIESMCPQCEENGTTKLLLTKIPHFKDIIIISFDCPHCGFRSNEVQPGGAIAERGVKMELNIIHPEMLNRQVIKSNYARVIFPQLDFEIPAVTQKGLLNTVEGLLRTAAEQLQEGQEIRRVQDAETAARLDDFIARLLRCADGQELPLVMILDDPSGNSHVQNPYAPRNDPLLHSFYYERTPDQLVSMGFAASTEDAARSIADDKQQRKLNNHPLLASNSSIISADNFDFSKNFESNLEVAGLKQEPMVFPAECHSCHHMAENRMCVSDIPFFKEVVIMSFYCENCGARSAEIKAGGAIPAKGKRTTCAVQSRTDLSRDVLKSETSSVSIPELELELTAGSLGGLYTTVEGLLVKIRDHLRDNNPFVSGDSSENKTKEDFENFLSRFDDLISGERPFTLIVDDPLDNSFIMSFYKNPKEDPLLTIEEYERSFEQNEELGLNDINTENYAAEASDHPSDSTTMA